MSFFDFKDKTAAFYRDRQHDRWCTFHMALNWFMQTGGSNVVETGCIRNDSYCDGASTRLFSNFVKRTGARFWSVDIGPQNIELARKVIEPDDRISLVVGDSIEFLKSFPHRIDLLYLDSFDYDVNDPNPAQFHALEELRAALPKLGPKACVLIDDNSVNGGGKGELAKKVLYNENFICLLDHFQSCWVRA